MLCFGVEEGKQTQLADFIWRTMRDKGLKLRDVEERSGGRVSNSYISKLLGGHARNPTGDKLATIAAGLGVSLRELQAAAGGEPTNEAEFLDSSLYFLYQERLNADEETRTLIDQTIEMLLDRTEKARVER